jgi:hypothetical protein
MSQAAGFSTLRELAPRVSIGLLDVLVLPVV